MKIPESTILVIFGASGDLAYRKLIPAIYSLSQQKLLPDNFFILGGGFINNAAVVFNDLVFF